MVQIYLRRATEAFGTIRTREIYEKAIELLPEDRIKDICLQYAETEKKLGEIDRARAIYTYASQYVDPRVR